MDGSMTLNILIRLLVQFIQNKLTNMYSMLLELLTCVGHMRIVKLRSVEQKQKSTFVQYNKQQLYSQFNCQYINMETTTYNLYFII